MCSFKKSFIYFYRSRYRVVTFLLWFRSQGNTGISYKLLNRTSHLKSTEKVPITRSEVCLLETDWYLFSKSLLTFMRFASLSLPVANGFHSVRECCGFSVRPGNWPLANGRNSQKLVMPKMFLVQTQVSNTKGNFLVFFS